MKFASWGGDPYRVSCLKESPFLRGVTFIFLIGFQTESDGINRYRGEGIEGALMKDTRSFSCCFSNRGMQLAPTAVLFIIDEQTKLNSAAN